MYTISSYRPACSTIGIREQDVRTFRVSLLRRVLIYINIPMYEVYVHNVL